MALWWQTAERPVTKRVSVARPRGLRLTRGLALSSCARRCALRNGSMPEVDVKLLSPLENATLGGIAGTIEVGHLSPSSLPLLPTEALPATRAGHHPAADAVLQERDAAEAAAHA